MNQPASARTSAANGHGRIAGIDGLRAVAVALVLVDHLLPAGLDGGFIGVDVFFVISGFLITGLLLAELEQRGRIRLREFWRRRARRLLPALAPLLTLCMAVAAVEGGDVLLHIGSQLLGAITFSSNWVLIAQGSSYFDLSAPELFRNLWSLAVEEQFYLLWPFVVLLIALLPRRARPVPVLLLAVGSAVLMAVLVGQTSITRVYFGTDTHAFGLAIGAALALASAAAAARQDAVPATRASRMRWRTGGGLLGLLALVELSARLDETVSWTFPLGLVAASLAAALVILSLIGHGAGGTAISRLLELPPLRWIGRRSYGLYLWHWPVLILAEDALPQLPREGASGWALGLGVLAVTVAIAALSYRFVEEPLRRDGLRASWHRVAGAWRASATGRVATVLLSAVTVAALVTAGLGVASAPARSQTEQQLRAAAASSRPTLPPLPQPVHTAAGAMPFVPGGIGGPQLTVIGDSVTLAAQPTLERRWPGIDVEAAVSRQASEGPALVQQLADAGQLRPVLVLALGTNGPFSERVLRQVRAELGPERELVLVTTQSPRPWVGQVNQLLTDYCAQDPRCAIAPWFQMVQPQLGLLNRDQTHFGSAGARLWADALAQGLAALAERMPAKPLLPQTPFLVAPASG